MELWVGIDEGGSHGHVTALDRQGRVVLAEDYTTDHTSIRQLVDTLTYRGGRVRRQVHVGFENRDGLLAQHLVRLGFDVVHTHCVAVARTRERLTPSGAKTDRGDSFAIAHIIRTEPERHHRPPRPSVEMQALRVLTRGWTDICRQQRRLKQQIGSDLRAYYPAALHAFGSDYANTYQRAALKAAPTPFQAQHMTIDRMAVALRSAGRVKQVRDAASRYTEALKKQNLQRPHQVERAHGQVLISLLDAFEEVLQIRNDLETRSFALAENLPDWGIYRSFPGLTAMTGIRLMSEIGDDHDRFGSVRGLLCVAGFAPVTKASGDNVFVQQRTAYNRRLHSAIRDWWMPLVTHSDVALQEWRALRKAHPTFGAAQRRLMAHWTRALHHCLITREPFDEARLRNPSLPRPDTAKAGAAALGELPALAGYRHQASKYDGLRDLLIHSGDGSCTLTMVEIDDLVTGGLPPSAYRDRGWWYHRQMRTSAQARAWITAGYDVGLVDWQTMTVRFDPLKEMPFPDPD